MTQAAALDFDHVELLIGTVENAADANAKAVRNTVLSPRFYTTDFDAMDKLNIESVRAEWEIMMKEYEGDNNHDHFQRDAAFADEVRELMPQLSPEMRQEFLDFLISSLTSEFSGQPSREKGHLMPTPHGDHADKADIGIGHGMRTHTE